jgi:hypothetical protein
MFTVNSGPKSYLRFLQNDLPFLDWSNNLSIKDMMICKICMMFELKKY